MVEVFASFQASNVLTLPYAPEASICLNSRSEVIGRTSTLVVRSNSKATRRFGILLVECAQIITCYVHMNIYYLMSRISSVQKLANYGHIYLWKRTFQAAPSSKPWVWLPDSRFDLAKGWHVQGFWHWKKLFQIGKKFLTWERMFWHDEKGLTQEIKFWHWKESFDIRKKVLTWEN